MKAKDHTEAMLRWWRRVGVESVDLAIRRPDGALLWHHRLGIGDLPLAWVRSENVRHADVYVRPARGEAWPVVFLDDVPPAVARRVAAKYAALVVETSPVGGCHLWLVCRWALDEVERSTAQRWLVERIEADPASTSGEHLGRLAGFKNWKRSGAWVNVRRMSGGRAWDPSPAVPCHHPRVASDPSPLRRRLRSGPDRSESGREWGWVCGRSWRQRLGRVSGPRLSSAVTSSR